MHMPKQIFLVFFGALFCFGCKASVTSLMGIPIPLPAEDIYSVQYYNKTYGIDVYSQHEYTLSDRSREIIKANEIANKLLAKIKININTPPDLTEIYNSRQVSNNSYEVKCEQRVSFQKQINDTSCWAACVQYILLRNKNKYLDQAEIIEKYQKKEKEFMSSDSRGSTMNMISALGIFGYSLSQGDSHGIVFALAHDQPVILGYSLPNGEGHTVILLKAQYSFASYGPPVLRQHTVAFTSFDVLDPADGQLHSSVPASQYDGKITCTLYYHASS